ncbi:hypothetical protein KI387_014130 [Taxus chinensis]|uniref:CCHC-type domain-containing protein n=1 Tax=Taxus chinensis TaxID=29808 RepID=A0AA38FHY4_TAXCH|nr:hypothetical protein KI387_014130 [Taxus chinensis]
MVAKSSDHAKSRENDLRSGGGNGSVAGASTVQRGGVTMGPARLGHSSGLQGSCDREKEWSPSNPNPNPSKSVRDAYGSEAGRKRHEPHSKTKTYAAASKSTSFKDILGISGGYTSGNQAYLVDMAEESPALEIKNPEVEEYFQTLNSQLLDYENTPCRCIVCKNPGHLQASCPSNKNGAKKRSSSTPSGWGTVNPDLVSASTFKGGSEYQTTETIENK